MLATINLDMTLEDALPESILSQQDGGEFDAVSGGQWADLGGGAQLWSLTIRSPGALSQMVLFR